MVSASYVDEMDFTMKLWHTVRNWAAENFGDNSEGRRNWFDYLLIMLVASALLATVYTLFFSS